MRTGYFFNNITYTGTVATWAGNRLATPGAFTSGLHQWRILCTPNAAAGVRSCSAYIWTKVYSRHALAGGGYAYTEAWAWVFNDVVIVTA